MTRPPQKKIFNSIKSKLTIRHLALTEMMHSLTKQVIFRRSNKTILFEGNLVADTNPVFDSELSIECNFIRFNVMFVYLNTTS